MTSYQPAEVCTALLSCLKILEWIGILTRHLLNWVKFVNRSLQLNSSSGRRVRSSNSQKDLPRKGKWFRFHCNTFFSWSPSWWWCRYCMWCGSKVRHRTAPVRSVLTTTMASADNVIAQSVAFAFVWPLARSPVVIVVCTLLRPRLWTNRTLIGVPAAAVGS